MEKKTLEERYGDEILTDNTALNHFKQCKDCLFRDRTSVQGKECGWDKGCCRIYPYPESKPHGVYKNIEPCEFYEKE